MFSPRNTPMRSGVSPFTATPQSVKSAQTRRVANVFTPQRKAQQNRSLLQTSQILEETANIRVEKYGQSLPVLITEALMYADKSTRISVKTEDSGWAWLVGGRKLFVWRYKNVASGRNILCKELTLPPSDLAHSAARVCVIPSAKDAQTASCIAVSPEGVVRYWSNIAYESSSMEISAELKGEECDCVVSLYPYGFLLATTTSSLVLIATDLGQNSVTVRPLKAAHGMFAGIGRRMSSLIFGGGPGHATGAPLQAVIVGNHEEDERPFFVLSGTQLQKWVVSDFNMEKFLYQIDADRLFRESLARKVWDQDSIQMTQLTTWLLDMQLTSEGVMILGAGLNLESEPLVRYAVATIPTDASGTPSRLESFTVLSFVSRYQEEREAEILGYRLLAPYTSHEEVYLYNDSTIIIDTGEAGKPEEITAPGGRLLGAGLSDNTAVFFSISQGLISISSTQKQQVSILGDTTLDVLPQADMSTLGTNTTQIQELSRSEDKFSRLKAAFLSACGGNVRQAQEIVDELFAGDSHTGEIDRLVVGLSQDLIDDYPSSDPRWAENIRPDQGSSTSSLIILHQLKDKQRAHEYIINFLKKLDLWDKLRTMKTGDHVMSTRLLLCQHAEQLEAAIVLREMHSEYNVVIDPAIRKVLSFRGEQVTSGLSPHDIFYREVSHVYEIFEALLEYESDIMSGNFQPADVVRVISMVNPVMEGMLHAALQYRQSKASVYQTGPELETQPEYIPWTSTGGPSGIRTLIHKQFTLTLETAVPETRDPETQGQLFHQLLALADNLLEGYSSQLASLAQNPAVAEYHAQLEEKYVQERHRLISPFLKYEQYEKAGSLAEKYSDFELLIRICEETGNQDRIYRYQQQFSDKNFSDYLFSWYMKEGKRGRLLSLPSMQQGKLQNFLQKDEFGYLKWLHDIECKQFDVAHRTLLSLGRNEQQYLAKKKTLLSLSKLAALAYDGEEDEDMQSSITNIDEEQQLILNQELLPADLLEAVGFDPEQMKVLTPVELIQLYISDENSSATEFDFKKALELLDFIDKDDPSIDYEQLRASIWCKAILRDRAVWQHTPTGDPIDSVKDTTFFKTISLTVSGGSDPRSFLPDFEQIVSPALMGSLSTDKQLRFLVGTVYEMATSVF